MALGTADFERALGQALNAAARAAAGSVTIKAGELHRKLGDYPGPEHRMPICCEVMYKAVCAGDEVIEAPPKGKGASLKIRYQLPRN